MQRFTPGRELAVRLTAPGWLGGKALGIGIGLAICSVALIITANGLPQSGGWGWGMLIVLLLLAWLWLYLIYNLVRQVRQSALGKPLVEISDHPLRPGQSYRLLFRWPGAPPLESLRLTLLCTEVVEYTEGTDTRTESAEVRVDTLRHLGEGSAVDLSGDLRCEFFISPEAMHSFQSPHNQVVWAIRVDGAFVRWGTFDHRFSITVCPPEPREDKP